MTIPSREDAKLYLLKWRIERRLSQAGMAKYMTKRKVKGVTQGIISKWERGERTPTLTQAFALEDVGVGPARMWADEVPRN
jgi:transcriptional regulator with XRE-family HTH domain